MLGAFLAMPFRLAGRLALAAYRALRRSRRRRANWRALADLSDAQLRDIGIGRSEIPYAIWGLEYERDRAQLRARSTAGWNGPKADKQAAGERPAGDGSRAADAPPAGRLVPLPLRPKHEPRVRPGAPEPVLRIDRDAC